MSRTSPPNRSPSAQQPRPVALAAALALAVAMSLPIPGCMAPSAPARTVEEAQDVRQTLLSDAQAVERYRQHTLEGQNVSEFSLGWTVYSILVTLGSEDPELYDYLTKGNRDIPTYLKTSFKNHPEQEIAAIKQMAEQDNPTLRSTAAASLEALRHIPTDKQSPADQARAREALAPALETLKGMLEKTAGEITASP
jgi:hypothetical protein